MYNFDQPKKEEIKKIQDYANNLRLELGFTKESPIANEIFTILDKLEIALLEYPIKPDGDKPAFSAVLIHLTNAWKELSFIGLNTADYYDKQIFAVAHELYHYITKTGSHLSRLTEEQNDLTEINANRFAAEFLLPEDKLESIIVDEFETYDLSKVKQKTLLRFIARLHCIWWLPYRSIVRRLKEIEAISTTQFDNLYNHINERDFNGEYGSIGTAINKEVFTKLNTLTQSKGTSPNNIEIILRNFEDNIIDEDQLSNLLNLFDKKPENFGYEINVSKDDLIEFETFFNEGENDDN
ncbi:ImmA/IrrE family metallo-endopeptidase [Natranaerobius thermophilus]|uniref:IrrE N-terminal-like domain-containing protein n=1 Tax=Natranaerobius thermophilus (strain ATCC BAA-1301 / DSM 18059 / JW/NM-WN-LF) TaxID=457570 RepID=B2A1Q3_NATTJ|nr:ImmA/IrrE family metallo-endopeptidase [Natranaerobius thermophilus]ACB86100.1 protein of unknown function DUF955 [Natranaerobius thermophilus JW/NM-WN-LF]